MTTQTAMGRELLLVPVPATREAGAPPEGSRSATHPDAEAVVERRRARKAPRRLGPRARVLQVALLAVAALLVGMVTELALVGGLEHRSAQINLFNQFRVEVALGTGPLGPVGPDRRPLAAGSPIAYLEIPSIGVHQVVLEGTSSAVLANGPGHVRSTVFPGGAGTSVVLGRANAFGGPFGDIGQLHRGATVKVVNASGVPATFRVVDVHHAGARVLGPVPGTARLTLGTATGPAFAPTGVVWVDADKVGRALPSYRPLVGHVPASEQPLGTDGSAFWYLILGVEALVGLVVLATWSWRARGHGQTWVVFTAPVLLVGILVADQLARLLPNLT